MSYEDPHKRINIESGSKIKILISFVYNTVFTRHVTSPFLFMKFCLAGSKKKTI